MWQIADMKKVGKVGIWLNMKISFQSCFNCSETAEVTGGTGVLLAFNTTLVLLELIMNQSVSNWLTLVLGDPL